MNELFLQRVIVVSLAGFLFHGMNIAQQRRPQDVEWQAALRTESVTGDLRAAITHYEAILAKYPSDRALAAKVLLHIADCHQKLGDPESRRLYQRVLREYTDQPNALREARARLSQNASPVNRLVMTTEATDVYHVDAEGFAVAVDWSKDGVSSLVSRNMATGETHTVLPGRDPDIVLDCPLLSPDHKMLAYTQYHNKDKSQGDQLWVVNLKPASNPRLIGRYSGGPCAAGWSPDRRSLLSVTGGPGSGAELSWISLADGTAKSLKKFAASEWFSPEFRLSPDGRFVLCIVSSGPNGRESRVYLLSGDSGQSVPVALTAGFNGAAEWTPDGRSVLFVSDRTGTYDLWSIPIRDGKPSGEALPIRRNIGRITGLGITRAGTYYYHSRNSFETISVIQLKPAARTEETIVGLMPSVSPDGKRIAFTRQRSEPRKVDLIIRSRDTGDERSFSRDGLVSAGVMWFHHSDAVLATTYDSNRRVGAVHRVDLSSGDFTKLLDFHARLLAGDLYALSPDDRTLYIWGREIPDGPANRVIAHDLMTGQQRPVFTLPAGKKTSSGISLSPSGKEMALHAVDDQFRYVVRVGVDGTGYRELYKGRIGTISGNVFHPGGQSQMFARQTADKRWEIMSVSTEGGAPVSVGLYFATVPQAFSMSASGTQLALYTTRGVGEVWALDYATRHQ